MMKVKIEFNDFPNDECYDLESTFDSCEFSTVPAGTHESWGDAVRDFVATSGSRFDHQLILCEALIVEGGHGVDWETFVALLSDEAAAELRVWLSQG